MEVNTRDTADSVEPSLALIMTRCVPVLKRHALTASGRFVLHVSHGCIIMMYVQQHNNKLILIAHIPGRDCLGITIQMMRVFVCHKSVYD